MSSENTPKSTKTPSQQPRRRRRSNAVIVATIGAISGILVALITTIIPSLFGLISTLSLTDSNKPIDTPTLNMTNTPSSLLPSCSALAANSNLLSVRDVLVQPSANVELFGFSNPLHGVTCNIVSACGRSGQGLQIDYDFTNSGDGGAGVRWDHTFGGHFDAAQFRFTQLTFWVKGSAGGETFEIGLKNRDLPEQKLSSKPYVTVAASHWTQATIPLLDFQLPVDYIRNVNFGFNRNIVPQPTGSICIDEIEFK